MQIESFRVFCDLAETESFTKAAQINGITQSAVSQQITSLERQLKSLLIERSKKKFRLTREGQLLYEYGKQVIQTYDSLLSRLQEVKDIISGTIRLATIYSIGLHDLPPYIRKFLRAYPTVNVHVDYQRADQVYEDVLGNVVDLGLVAYPNKESRLEVIPLRNERCVVIAHPNHPLARNRSIRLEQLNGQKFIGFEPDIPTRKAIDKVLRERGVNVHHVMEFDNIETVKRAVEIEAGISIVPEQTVLQEIAKQTLVAMTLSDAEIDRLVAVIHKKNKVLSPAMKQFIEMLKMDSLGAIELAQRESTAAALPPPLAALAASAPAPAPIPTPAAPAAPIPTPPAVAPIAPAQKVIAKPAKPPTPPARKRP
jgi:DNA-binding transcriptional LysR family regulator